MKLPSKSLLSVALLTTLVGSGVVLAQQAAPTVDPQTLVGTPTAPQAAPAAPQAVMVPPSPGAPAPVPATTPVITTPSQSTPVVVAPTSPTLADPEVERMRAAAEAQALRITQMTASGADESVLLREVSRYQARLSLLNAAAEVEKAQQEMVSDRTKFQLEQAKTQAELAAAKTPALAPGAVGLPGQPGVAGSVLPQEEKLDVSLLGVSSFGGKRLAEVSSSEFGSMAVEAGATLPNGARVSSITDRSVVIVHRGKRSTIYLSGGSSGTSASSAKPPAPTVNKK